MTGWSLTLTFQFPSTKLYWQQDGSVYVSVVERNPSSRWWTGTLLRPSFFYYDYLSPLWFDKYSATHHWSGQLDQLYRLLFVANGDERPDPSEKWRVPQWGDIGAVSVARHDARGGDLIARREDRRAEFDRQRSRRRTRASHLGMWGGGRSGGSSLLTCLMRMFGAKKNIKEGNIRLRTTGKRRAQSSAASNSGWRKKSLENTECNVFSENLQARCWWEMIFTFMFGLNILAIRSSIRFQATRKKNRRIYQRNLNVNR